jgi:hypothetical protein
MGRTFTVGVLFDWGIDVVAIPSRYAPRIAEGHTTRRRPAPRPRILRILHA